MFDAVMMKLLGVGVAETLFMTLLSTLLAYAVGLPLGIVMIVTDKNGIRPRPLLNKVLDVIINILRSVPFLILMIVLIPFTRAVAGTTIGPKAAVVSLVVAAAPFIARLVESSIKEVDYGVIEAAQSMGASPMDIVRKVLLPEAKPSLIVGSAIAVTTILSYSAMAGIIGGGGLGAIAINYGYYRYETGIMLVTVALLVIIVQIFQDTGMRLAKKFDKRF